MIDMIDDEKEALKREKNEFMYQFEGAMSVIHETEEPDDEITAKNSQQSSRLNLMRVDSVATPNLRMSKEPVPNRPSDHILISPRSVMI